MAESNALLMRYTRKGIRGSNPLASAFGPPKRTYGVTRPPSPRRSPQGAGGHRLATA